MSSRNKGLACGGLFLLLTVAAFALLLRGQDPGQLWSALIQADPRWLAVGAGCMACYFCCEARNIRTGLSLFGSSASYPACLRYALTGFFFSSITPSASGGQPMQLLAMHQDGHPAAPGVLALLTEFFSFQLAGAVLAVGGFLLCRQELLALDKAVQLCFLVGAGLNLVVVLLLCTALFSPRLLPFLWGKLMIPAGKLFPRRAEGWAAWGRAQWADLRRCTHCYRTNKKKLAGMVAVSLLQLAACHSIPYWVYLAFGLENARLVGVIGMQAVLFLSVSSLPLPGAVGLSEGGFLLLYRSLFPPALISGAMILSRVLSFYLCLAVSGAALCASCLFRSSRKNAPASCE